MLLGKLLGVLLIVLVGVLFVVLFAIRILTGALFGEHQVGCISCLQVVLNITNTFDSSFSRWTVGLGIEHQLNELRVAAGLEEESRFRTRARNLDYAQLVHPEVAIPVSSFS